MKNKLKIFLCVVMILVFSFGTCATAYAYTGYPTDIDTASSVVKSYYDGNDVSNNYYCLVERKSDNKVLLVTFSDINYVLSDNKVLFSNYPFSQDSALLLHRPKGYGLELISFKLIGYEFDETNLYSKPKQIYINTMDAITSNTGKDFHSLNIPSDFKILSSSYNMYQRSDTGDDVLVFPKGETNSPNPNPETPPSTPGSNILSSTFNTNLMKSKNPLQEILSLLPLLLPVLISFLSIRKGIRFTLQTLRSS